MKHTFSIPYLFNPGLLTGRLPNHLLKKVKKAVNDLNRRNFAINKYGFIFYEIIIVSILRMLIRWMVQDLLVQY